MFPIVWTIIYAIRGFARYHTIEHQHLLAQKASGGELQETPLSSSQVEEFRRLGQWLRKRLYKLGPTFIKIGQTLSTRADLLPLPAMLELSALQEEVEPYPTEIALATIARELGAATELLYASFNPTPVAAASLSQAYRAVLHDGRDVIVKVQRPNLSATIARDIQVLEAVASEIMRYPSLGRHTDWPGVVQEFARTTFEEIDYIREGRNADRFRHNFRNNNLICIPRIIWRLTGRRVLTIEYIPGVRVTDVTTMNAMGINRKAITQAGANFYLRQLLEDGFFHADPHPGNLRIMPDGRVGFFDFGRVGRISPHLKQALVDAFLHVIKKDYRALVDDFVAMGFLPEEVDRESLCRELSPIVEARFAEGLTRVHFRKLVFDFSDIVWRYPFRLPSEFTFIMRALLTLEGVAITINPDFNFIESALPFAQRLILKNNGATIGRVLLKEVFSEGWFNAQAAVNLFKAAARLSAATSDASVPSLSN
ncbi:MAG: AarF/ABC1/UbiB kinase family protein [Candidatus Melainabacteria bacterium]|nr:AarF/ABC1/UbiB kinase family protein [Candidatus Melainabacteria bacterium]